MKKIGILYHPYKETAKPLAQELEKFLKTKRVSAWVCSAWEVEAARAELPGTELILSIGGDGTILRAAQIVIPGSIPITGINLGNLGFMTELSVAEAKDKLAALLKGEGWIDERSLLEAELDSGGKNKPARRFFALNDVVVARGEVARVIQVSATIDSEPLTRYKADGIIVATATGSTGYSLSAGGPVLPSQSKDILMLPIMPHLSLAYPLVLPAAAVIKLSVIMAQTATLSVDGHINLPLSTGAGITIRHSQNAVRFLRIHPAAAFYSTLEQKLKGK